MQPVNYTVEELILDPTFIKWVKDPRNEEGKLWINWASISAENSRIIDEAKEIILEFAKDNDSPVQQELAELWGRITASNDLFDHQSARGSGGLFLKFIKSWQTVAAAVAAFLVVGALAMLMLKSDNTISTAYGQTKRLVLPDGSVVILNSNSSVTYSSEWDSEHPREIRLSGEGFFSVTHKANHQKFVVHTADLDIQVLGTKFNVNTRRGKTRVILESGKVKLFLAKKADKIIEMKPGDMVNFSSRQQHIEKKTVEKSDYVAWVNKKLVFDETTLKEIAQLLEDNYGYKVKFLVPQLESLTFTGTIDSGDIDLLLAILQKTFNISIVKKEGTISIDNK